MPEINFSEESREVAKAVLEELGGLEYIEKFDLPRCGKDGDEPSIWNVYLCVHCHTPIWKSSTVSEDGKDGWRISDFNSYEAAFGVCDACESFQQYMDPSSIGLAQRNAVSVLMLLGRMLLK